MSEPHIGDQSKHNYVNNFGGDGEFFDEIQFSTNGIAFEIDNAGYDVSEVPVPAALPLMASALGLFGLSNRKKNSCCLI